MNVESKRIFISDLPENTTEDEIREKFNRFGKVTLIDIKQRKDVGPKNRSQFFAFVNVDIDHRSLDQCFQEFNQKKWKGYYVEIQLAKESFLDRLKKERAEATVQTKTPEIVKPSPQYTPLNGVQLNGIKIDSSDSENEKTKKKNPNRKSSSSTSSSDDDEDEVVPIKNNNGEVVKVAEEIKMEDIYADIVVKNNKFKKVDNKIESFGFEPIVKIEKAKPKSKDPKRMEADQKRLDSMKKMKKGYQNQKFAIQAALSKVDFIPKNKITFEDNKKADLDTKKRKHLEAHNLSNKRKDLFHEEGDENDNEEFNFDVKKQFAGKQGQKLFELQSRYKNDSRFQMDERFAEEDEVQEQGKHVEENMTQDEERRKQLEILGEVLGTKFTPKHTDQNKKSMLRFDPSQPEHSKYEMKDQQPEKKKKRKTEERKIEELPKVSEDKFYQVQDSLKDAFQERESFSLLNMFGRSQNEEKNNEDEEKIVDLKPQKRSDLEDNRNPFKYDSSDDEDDKETNVNDIKNVDDNKTKHSNVGLGPSRLWTESFFFKDDDYRFQEGLDFIKKLEVDEKGEFGKIRRDLKTIVQAKVKNNQRNNKPFKKKLGGASRRKKIRVNKALKR